MEREQIIRMAREAGAIPINGEYKELALVRIENIERFFQAAYAAGAAAERERIKTANAPEIERVNDYIRQLEAAVAAEREACAKVCEELRFSERGPALEAKRQRDLCAMAIRARGQA